MKGLQGVWLAVMAGLAMAGCARPPETVAPPPDDPGPGVTADYTPGQVSVAPQIQLARPNLAASTLAGTGTAGKRDGAAGQAQFQAPEGVAVAADGTVFVAEPYAYRIRQISPSGTVSTLAGGAGGTPGRADGVGSLASFMGPKDVAIAPNGDLYVVDFDGVRRVTRDGHVSTLALHNADGSEYQPIELFGIACDRSGTLYSRRPPGSTASRRTGPSRGTPATTREASPTAPPRAPTSTCLTSSRSMRAGASSWPTTATSGCAGSAPTAPSRRSRATGSWASPTAPRSIPA